MNSKIKYIILSILLFSIFPGFIKANAIGCPNADKVRYQEQAKNVKLSYNAIEDGNNVSFSIRITNIPEGFTVRDRKKNVYHTYQSSELNLDGYTVGTNYRFDISTPSCSDVVLYSVYASLPYYNRYYKSTLCEGIEDFKYCQKWTKEPSSYTEFEQAINNYKKNLEKQDEETNKKSTIEGLFDTIKDFYLNYYFIILPLIIVILILIIIRRRKKGDLF